jgi:hypothetical protein
MAGSMENNAATLLLINSLPAEWQLRITEMPSAFEAIIWVCDQFDGGKNTYLIDELERKFAVLKYSSTESWEQYVMRANNLASNMTSNGHPVSKTTLVTRIVQGLPDSFDNSRASLRLTGKNWSLDELCYEIKAEAFNLKITQEKKTAAKAIFVEEKPAFVGKPKQQGSGSGGKGNSHKKIKGDCWNCSKAGHSYRECRGPNTNFAFKPGNSSGNAEPKPSAEELVSA